jgi:phenylalanyl-tRNA synthetase alpha chain
MMDWKKELENASTKLNSEFEDLEEKTRILKSQTLKDLYSLLSKVPNKEKKELGQAINNLKKELQQRLSLVKEVKEEPISSIDVTAPFDVNSKLPEFLGSENGTIHPISKEIEKVSEIFNSMGFEIFESRAIDDSYHMFTSLNFPEDHPARDDYDTFITEAAENSPSLIAPAHTSTMQNRILSLRKSDLEHGRPIAAAVPDRCFRNEDVDARHEHTFHQVEGIYVDKNVNVGNLIATLKTFLSAYYEKEIESRVNPFYFPFTEPSFEFALSCPFCEKAGCHICSQAGWIELLGCGMIHPNVLEMAGIDSKEYSGFAFGCGIERLVMMKYGVEDVRLFHSARLKFLKQF